MTHRARLRYVGLAVLLSAAVICFLLGALLNTGTSPISLNVVRIGQNQNGSQTAVLELTNHTHYRCNVYAFWTEVLSNGVWVDSATQHPDARNAEFLPAHAHRTLEVPVPHEGTAWRIQMDALRPKPLSRVEALVNRVCDKLKVRSPVALDMHLFSETNRVAP